MVGSEIGGMARSVQVFQQAAIRNQDLETDAASMTRTLDRLEAKLELGPHAMC